MKFTSGTVALLGLAASACIGTMDALVKVRGSIGPSVASGERCEVFLHPASRSTQHMSLGREVRGEFVQHFIVHPWERTYRVIVKCGEAVRLDREVEYRAFGEHPYDLGIIAP